MTYKTKIFLVGIAGMAVSICLLAGSLLAQKPLTELTRPQKGADSVTEHLQVKIGEDLKTVDVPVAAVPFEEKEQCAQLQETAERLEDIFLAQNDSLDHVTMDVDMPTGIADSPVEIQWYLDSWEYLEPDGTVKNEGITEDISVQVHAVLSFDQETLVWNRSVTICPPEEPDADMLVRMLQYQIREQQREGTAFVKLPERVHGKTVIWYPQRDDRWMWTMGLTVIAVCGLWFGRKKDEEQEWKQYERKMQLSYPDIVNRLSLYMGAGISTKRAWERIVQGYEQKSQNLEGKDPAYEQMKITYRQMQSGVAETEAYEEFGMKSRLPSYLKLGTLLSQNLRLGTRDLTVMLKAEAKDAFEDRKALAKKMGEECESKLLLPMLLMLLSILLMIMYPAVVSFAG